ncbi:MAG: Uma2 family endonuclease [Thioalkalivibrio sp.]|nr:Uma2 family endonuclease [Thioalkalivibrio sp.]
MAVRFAHPYRFDRRQFAGMAAAGVIPPDGIELVEGIPWHAGEPVRFSSADYHRLGAAGVFHPDERVELIDGEVIEMMTVGGPHSTAVFDVDDYLHSVAGAGLHVVMQSALHLPGSQLVPDVMLLRRAAEVRGELPSAAACLLVVEVADSSARFDRTEKRELYARAGIPEYWVVDLTAQTVVLHLRPVSGDYHDVAELARGSRFVSPAFGGLRVPVDELLR